MSQESIDDYMDRLHALADPGGPEMQILHPEDRKAVAFALCCMDLARPIEKRLNEDCRKLREENARLRAELIESERRHLMTAIELDHERT